VRSTPRRARRYPRSAANPLRASASTAPRIPLDRFPLRDDAVLLRPFELDDASDLAIACRDPLIPKWTFMPEGLTVPQATEWIERADDAIKQARAVRLAILAAADNAFLGQVGIGHLNWEQQTGEIFYWLAASARGRGVATRAVKLLTAWSFDALDLARIEITVDPANERSQRVAHGAGFTREGVLRSYQRFKEHRMDAVMFSRLPTDP
jgi:RimJ/RimL family protein N-acetyltransferase